MSSGNATSSSDENVLEPYGCLPLKGPKYARECQTVYLSKLGGTSLSPNFQYFTNLQVVWLNDNRLNRLENLEPCFRITDMYVQNNRLVSLDFLKQFKFLRVFCASNNQIRNLDKQLHFLKRLSYLRKADLFDNGMAEEPDYRLRMIYHCPQIEILDKLGVTWQQRERAEEVVPNMDKVAPSQPVKAMKKAYSFTNMERDCFRKSKAIRSERLRVEEDALKTQVFSTGISHSAPFPIPKHHQRNLDKWSSQSRLVDHEHINPTPWEKQWDDPNHKSMKAQIEELATSLFNKEELNREDVAELARQLYQEGLEDCGRALRNPDVFSPLPAAVATESPIGKGRRREPPAGAGSSDEAHPLETLNLDADAVMPLKKVATFLVSLEWHRLSDDALDRKIEEHAKQARLASLRATFGVKEIKFGEEGDDQAFFQCRDKVARLEGLKTRKSEVLLVPKPETGILRKSRSDVFSQTFLKPMLTIDEATGKKTIQLAKSGRHTAICDHPPPIRAYK
jgi:hypothetical protein